MSQIFRRSTNALARATIFGAIFFISVAGWGWYRFTTSSYVSGQNVVSHQPIPFSHQHHVAGLGLDCRYCHTSVETSSFAGIPPTATCMNCHKLIWKESPFLAPVRNSFKTGIPIQWVRVNDLPDFVYFNHSIHVAKGIGCATCHGRVDKMPLMMQHASLQMRWCVDCHRDPAKFIRPENEVFNMAWKASDQDELGPKLVKEYHIRSARDLTSCSTCHR